MSDLSPEVGADVAGPESGTGTAEQDHEAAVDWQKRYADLQPEYTRATQELAELRRQQELYDLLVSTDDADTRRQIAEQLGYVLDEEPDEPELDPEDPFAHYDERLGRIEQSLTQRQQEEQDATYAAEVRRKVDARLDQLGLDKADQDWVLAYAINALPALHRTELPAGARHRRAHQAFIAARDGASAKTWAGKTKTAPHLSPHGQAATEVPNLDNRQERRTGWSDAAWRTSR
jgi:hypothetical protein